MEKKEKNFYKKWWFWVIILIIVVIIAFASIMIVALKEVTSGVSGLAIKIQDVYEDATVYTSAGNNVLFLELDNWDTEYSDKLAQIIKIVKNASKNKELENYSKFVSISYIKSNGKDNVLCIKETYTLPDFTKESEKEYILFDEYQEMFDKYSDAMKGYIGLFNSTY